MKKHIGIGSIISIVLIIFIFRKIDFHELMLSFKRVNYLWILLVSVLLIVNLYLKGYRWKILFNKPKHISTYRLMHFFTIGIMANNFLPFRMGEVLRVYLTSKKLSLKNSKVAATVVVERILDMLALLAILFSVFFLFKKIAIPISVRNSSVVLLAITLIIFIVLLISRKERRLIVYIFEKLPKFKFKDKLLHIVHMFLDGLESFSHAHHFIQVIGLSLFIWLFEGGVYYILTVAFGISVSYAGCLFLMVVICLGVMVPSAPGYIGVFEATTIAGFAVLGVGKTEALSFALFVHAFQILVISIAGFYFLWNEGMSFRDLKMQEDNLEEKSG
ncbi:lysylphosphatidylglycerol synthase transmembrane domain-containing protein [bacterium]